LRGLYFENFLTLKAVERWEEQAMARDNSCKPVKVSRTIEAPADRIFAILADPVRHLEFDGSDMLRGSLSDAMISGVGAVFSMKMHFEPLGGDYVMINKVIEYESGRRISWEPAPGDAIAAQDGAFTIGVPPGHKWTFELTPDGADTTIVTEIFDCSAAPEELRDAVQNGEIWIDAMTATLARLDSLCCASPSVPERAGQ
jgi:uncharacterized protein YndB with AHSA1/START domain